jgi:hypothetical protein
MPHTTFLSSSLPSELEPVRDAFLAEASILSSDSIRKVEEVRARIEPHLRRAGWSVGEGARSRGGIALARSQGPAVRADAVNAITGAALWIETGRSWTNNGFLEHLIEAVPCLGVDHLALAIRTVYDGSAAYSKAVEFLGPVIDSGRLGLPYESVLLIGF